MRCDDANEDGFTATNQAIVNFTYQLFQVITCEGNAAYYEVGAFEYPLREGYSAMGWNHPGFGYSTGMFQASTFFPVLIKQRRKVQKSVLIRQLSSIQKWSLKQKMET